jgi:putative glutamine amidotransferase
VLPASRSAATKPPGLLLGSARLNQRTRPLIGITGRKDSSARLLRASLHSVGETYTRAVHRAGGTPVIIPPLTQEVDWKGLLERLDGLLLSGGEDITPDMYGQASSPWTGQVDGERDSSEIGLVRLWLAGGKPLLAICRGHQLLNVALGGTLMQDIAAQIQDALDHGYLPGRPMEFAVHTVDAAPESRLAAILGGVSFPVNSAHHQAVAQAGRGLAVVAWASDGVIEATEMPDHPFCLAVQWHPEAMLRVSTAMLPLFEAFVRASAGGECCSSAS